MRISQCNRYRCEMHTQHFLHSWFALTFAQEFKTGVINIEEHEPHVVKAILQYLYTSFYTLDRNSEEHHSVTHANIYAAGEDLGIEGVKKLAIDQFDACMEQSPKSSFVAARTIFTTTPSFDKELRTVFINKASEHFSLVVGDTPEFQQNRDVIKDIPELAYELVLARARTNVPGNVLWKASGVFECSNCPQTGYVSKILYGGILRCPECFGILQSPTHCLQTWKQFDMGIDFLRSKDTFQRPFNIKSKTNL